MLDDARLLTLWSRLIVYWRLLNSLLLLLLWLPHNWIDLRYIYHSLSSLSLLRLHLLWVALHWLLLLHLLLVTLHWLLVLHGCYWLLLRNALLGRLLHLRLLLVLHRLLAHVLWLLLLLRSLLHLRLLDALRFHPDTMRQLLQPLLERPRIIVLVKRLCRSIQRFF